MSSMYIKYSRATIFLFILSTSTIESVFSSNTKRVSVSLFTPLIAIFDYQIIIPMGKFEYGFKQHFSASFFSINALPNDVVNFFTINGINFRYYLDTEFIGIWSGPGVAVGYNNNNQYSFGLPLSAGYLFNWSHLFLDPEIGFSVGYSNNTSNFEIGYHGNIYLGYQF